MVLRLRRLSNDFDIIYVWLSCFELNFVNLTVSAYMLETEWKTEPPHNNNNFIYDCAQIDYFHYLIYCTLIYCFGRASVALMQRYLLRTRDRTSKKREQRDRTNLPIYFNFFTTMATSHLHALSIFLSACIHKYTNEWLVCYHFLGIHINNTKNVTHWSLVSSTDRPDTLHLLMHTWCMAHKVGNFQLKQLLEFFDTTSLASISFAPGPYVSYSGNKFCCWLEITMQLIDSHSHCWKLILLSHINYEYVTHLTIVYAFQLNEIKEEIIQILEYSNIVLNYSQLHTATHTYYSFFTTQYSSSSCYIFTLCSAGFFHLLQSLTGDDGAVDAVVTDAYAR